MDFGFGGTSSFQDKQPIVTQPPSGADKGGNAGKGAATGAAGGAMTGAAAGPWGALIGAVVGAAAGAMGGAMSNAGATPGSGTQLADKAANKWGSANPFTKSPSDTSNSGFDAKITEDFFGAGKDRGPFSNETMGQGLGMSDNPYASLSPEMQQYLQEHPEILMNAFSAGGY